MENVEGKMVRGDKGDRERVTLEDTWRVITNEQELVETKCMRNGGCINSMVGIAEHCAL